MKIPITSRCDSRLKISTNKTAHAGRFSFAAEPKIFFGSVIDGPTLLRVLAQPQPTLRKFGTVLNAGWPLVHYVMPVPMNALFRSEVQKQRQHRLMSGVSLVQPTPWRWLAGTALAMPVIVIALLIFGDYTQRIRVTGVLKMSPASGPIEAHIEVPSTAIAFVHPGDASFAPGL